MQRSDKRSSKQAARQRRLRRTIGIPLVACSMGLVAGLAPGSSASAAVSGGPVLALTSVNSIVSFDAASPTAILEDTPITGLQAGESIVGFDVRPATGELFAIGVTGTTGRMYVINVTTGVATVIGAVPFSTVLPAGGTWSVDFNPSVDRIRFVHSTGVNYRLNPLNGGLAATDTTVTPGKATALAYDRSTAVTPMATTLFAIDDAADTLTLIGGLNGTPSPNLGATSTVGVLGVDAGASIGFDIAPQGDARATLQVGGLTGFYAIDLTTGAASLQGLVGLGATEIRDIALPRPPAGAMLALTTGNVLHRFDAATPSTLSSSPISGLQPGETMVGIDVRPATGQVIGIGLVGTAGRVYQIDPATGTATQIGTAPFAVAATASTWAVDFNPTVDRIRLANVDGGNYRVNPNNGALVQPDGNLTGSAISAVGYDRSVATATATTLYTIDSTTDVLSTAPMPNGGVTAPVGLLGVDAAASVGFDISPIGEAVASLRVAGTSGLYTINLSTGRAELLGVLGDGTPDVLDVAFIPKTVAGASQFSAVTPTRLIDTRSGAKPAAGSTTDLQVTGVGGVPANATAIVLNTTGTEATASGFVTVWPTGEARPTVSNHNLVAGQTRANLVTVKIGAGGKVSLFTQSGTHLIADVLGYYAPATGTAGRFTALTPARLIDTRTTTKVGQTGTVSVAVLGKGGVPATGVSSVLVNLAATEATNPGFVTAYAGGTPMPSTSNLNLERVGSTASNLSIVPVGADGSITVYSQQGAHIVVDVAGWYGDGTAKGGQKGLYVPVSPSRILDTREGLGAPTGALPTLGSLDLTVAAAGGVPAFGAASALLNVTSDATTIPGYLTVYPAGAVRDTVSSVNVDVAGLPTPNLVGATLGTAGKVTIFAQPGGHVIADVAGWFTS